MERSVWDPVALHAQKHLGALHHLVDVELREAKLSVTSIHALEVLVDAERECLGRIVVLQVGLCSFEALDTVMQSSVRGI